MTGTTNPGQDYKGEYEALAHALVGNTGASAILEASRHQRLLTALHEIARQKLPCEISPKDRADADYEGGYEAIITIARSAVL